MRYLIVLVPLLCAMFFLLYIAWQRRTGRPRSFFVQWASVFLVTAIIGSILLSAIGLILGINLDLAILNVNMYPRAGFLLAVKAHKIAIAGLSCFLMSSLLFWARSQGLWEENQNLLFSRFVKLRNRRWLQVCHCHTSTHRHQCHQHNYQHNTSTQSSTPATQQITHHNISTHTT